MFVVQDRGNIKQTWGKKTCLLFLTESSSWKKRVKLINYLAHSRRELNQLKRGLVKPFLALQPKLCPSSINKRKDMRNYELVFLVSDLIFISYNILKCYWKEKKIKGKQKQIVKTDMDCSWRRTSSCHLRILYCGSKRLAQHDSSRKGNSFSSYMPHTLVRLIR